MADKVDGPRRPALGLGRFGKFLAGSDITTSAYAKLAAENYARSCDDVLKLIDGPVRFSSTIPGIILKIALYVISAGILLFVYLWAINSDAFRVTVESCCKVVSQKLRKGSGTPKMQAPPGASDELHDDDMPLPRTGAHWDSGEEIHSPQPSGAQSSGAGTASTSASWAPNSGSGPSVPSPQPSGAGTASPPPPPAPSPGQSVPPTRPEGISDKWHRFFSTATSINVLDFWRGDIGVIIGRCDGTEPKIEYISHANLNNFYPNVKEIILECVKFKSDADFSGCEKIETVTVKDGVITGSLILGPRVRKLTVERLKVGGSIDLSKCCDLTDLTFECDGVLGSCYNGGLIFSPDLTTRVCLSGTWFDGRKYIDAIISKCKSAPNVKVINEASIRPSSIGELEHGALCRTTSVEVISRFNVSGAFSVEVVVGDCKVFLYDDDFSCYRDIEKIVIKSTLNNCADFSRLAYIKEVACIGARVKDVLVLGENVETFIAESSCFERGVDFSRCSKLSELRLVGCKDTGSRLGCGIEMSIFPPGCRAKVHLTGTWPKRAYLDSVRKLFGDRFPETFTCDATAKDDGIHDMLRCARAVHIDYRGSVGEIKLECWDSDANCIGSAEVAVDDIEILEPYGGIRSVVISGFRQSIDLSPFHFTEVACRDAYISGDVIFCESVERVCVECPFICCLLDFSKCASLSLVEFNRSKPGVTDFGVDGVRFSPNSHPQIQITGTSWPMRSQFDELHRMCTAAGCGEIFDSAKALGDTMSATEARRQTTKPGGSVDSSTGAAAAAKPNPKPKPRPEDGPKIQCPEGIDEESHSILLRADCAKVSFCENGIMSMELMGADGSRIGGVDRIPVKSLNHYCNIKKIILNGACYSHDIDLTEFIHVEAVELIRLRTSGSVIFGENTKSATMTGSYAENGADFSKCARLELVVLDDCCGFNRTERVTFGAFTFPPGHTAQIRITGLWHGIGCLCKVRKLFAGGEITVGSDDAYADARGLPSKPSRIEIVQFHGDGKLRIKCYDDRACSCCIDVAIEDLRSHKDVPITVSGNFGGGDLDLTSLPFTHVSCFRVKTTGNIIFGECVKAACVSSSRVNGDVDLSKCATVEELFIGGNGSMRQAGVDCFVGRIVFPQKPPSKISLVGCWDDAGCLAALRHRCAEAGAASIEDTAHPESAPKVEPVAETKVDVQQPAEVPKSEAVEAAVEANALVDGEDIVEQPIELDAAVRLQLMGSSVVHVTAITDGTASMILHDDAMNIAGAVEIPIAALNEFKNITTIKIDGSIAAFVGDVDFSTLKHITTYEISGLTNLGNIIFGPGAETVTLKNFSARETIDFGMCERLSEVTMHSWRGKSTLKGGVVFPSDRKFKLFLCGYWDCARSRSIIVDSHHKYGRSFDLADDAVAWPMRVSFRAPPRKSAGEKAAKAKLLPPDEKLDDRTQLILSKSSSITIKDCVGGIFTVFAFGVSMGANRDDYMQSYLGTVKIPLEKLDDFQNIFEINLTGEITRGDLNLSDLRHVRSVVCDDLTTARSAQITLGPTTESVRVLQSASLGGRKTSKVKLCFAGVWRNVDALNRLIRELHGNPNVEVENKATSPVRCSETSMKSAMSIDVCYDAMSAGECAFIGNVYGDCDTLLGSTTFSSLSGLAAWSGLRRLEICGITYKNAASIDFSMLANLEVFSLKDSSIARAAIVLGPSVELIWITRSSVGGGIDCSRCEKFKYVELESCGRVYISKFHRSFAEVGEGAGKIHANINGRWQKQEFITEATRSLEDYANVTVNVTEGYGLIYDPGTIKGAAKILGIEEKKIDTITKKEVKGMHKSKAMELHPDKNPDDPDATEKFQAMNAAYETFLKYREW